MALWKKEEELVVIGSLLKNGYLIFKKEWRVRFELTYVFDVDIVLMVGYSQHICNGNSPNATFVAIVGGEDGTPKQIQVLCTVPHPIYVWMSWKTSSKLKIRSQYRTESIIDIAETDYDNDNPSKNHINNVRKS